MHCDRADCPTCLADGLGSHLQAQAPICVVCRREPAAFLRLHLDDCGATCKRDKVCLRCCMSGEDTISVPLQGAGR